MDWAKGLSASYYMAIVDAKTWNDIERREITGGKIAKVSSGLRESADIDHGQFDGRQERWIRIWFDTRQAGESSHDALFTGLAYPPSEKYVGRSKTTPLECYSVLKPAADVLLRRGWYAPAGANGAELVRSMLREVTPAPVYITGVSGNLQQSIIAEDGETVLTMSDKILDAVGWRIRISGLGEIEICEKAKDASVEFGLRNDVVELEVTVERDWFDLPNVFRAVSDDMTAIARDDAEDSPLSTVSRGREVWMQESNCDLSDGESIEEYAMRRLKEEQAREVKVSYYRRYDPAVHVGDMVQLSYPEQGLQGLYKVEEQTITLEYGARVDEEVRR